MQAERPSDDTLYAALVARDPRFDGLAFVGVTTTGVFCRLTCSSRKPKRSNCRFFQSTAACLEAGFRPCKRCHPMDAKALIPAVQTLLDSLGKHGDPNMSEERLIALGFDPSTVRRNFKRQFGMTFLEMARLARIGEGFETLVTGGRVIDAQVNAGFESGSGFRSAFAQVLGQAPSSFTGDELMKADWLETPIGQMIAVSDNESLHLLEFIDRKALPAELRQLRDRAKGSLGIGRTPISQQVATELAEYFAGRSATFQTPLTLDGSPFYKSVWTVLRTISPGATQTYSDVARAIGRPTAVRAVARAIGANSLAIIVPCHRVIGADGTLTGYAGGLWRKQRLIELERHFEQASVSRSKGG